MPGPPAVFQFRNLETDIGCELCRSIVQAGNRTAWWSRRGWRMSTGGPSQPIGLGRSMSSPAAESTSIAAT